MIVPMIAGVPRVSGMGDILPHFWITPGEARDEEDQVNGAVQSLDSDIQASTATLSFKTAWGNFKAQWDQFYADQGGVTGWLSRFATSGGYNTALDYRTQLEQWRTQFQQQGGISSAPALPAPPTSSSSTSQTMKYVAITAGVLGGLWVLSTVYKESKGHGLL